MKKTLTLFSLLFIAFVATSASASVKKGGKKSTSSSAPVSDTLKVEIPQRDFDVIPAEQSTASTTAPRRPITAGVVMTGWAPSSYSPKSRVSEVTAYEASLPGFGLTAATPVLENKAGTLNAKLGVAIHQLKRTGKINVGTVNVPGDQALQLIPITLGADFEPAFAKSTMLVPYVSGALLPTVALSARSSLDDRVVAFGLPIELGMGVSTSPRWLANRLGSELKLNAGGIMTAGSLQGSSLFGLGVRAGLQIGI